MTQPYKGLGLGQLMSNPINCKIKASSLWLKASNLNEQVKSTKLTWLATGLFKRSQGQIFKKEMGSQSSYIFYGTSTFFYMGKA